MRKMISASLAFRAVSISHISVCTRVCWFFLIVIPLGDLAFNVLSACNIIILEHSTFLLFFRLLYGIWPLGLSSNCVGERVRLCASVWVCVCVLAKQCQVRLMPLHTLEQLLFWIPCTLYAWFICTFWTQLIWKLAMLQLTPKYLTQFHFIFQKLKTTKSL